MDISIDGDQDQPPLSDPHFLLDRSGEDQEEEDCTESTNYSGGGSAPGNINNVLHLSPKEVLSRLERGWINEKLAPELLPPLEQEKDAMLHQIKVMERNVASLDKKDMRTDIHKLELERIKFIVASYMRVRLFKLQEMSVHYYDLEVKRRLNPTRRPPPSLIREEFVFLKSLIDQTEEYYRTTLLSKMPLPLQKFELKKFRKRPSLDAFIFFRVQEATTVDVEDANTEDIYQISLGEGEQHVMRYQPMSKLLANESVYLV